MTTCLKNFASRKIPALSIDDERAMLEAFSKWMEKVFKAKILMGAEKIEFDTSMRTSHFIPKTKGQLWIECADKMTSACARVIEFANRIPAFSRLDGEDQMALLKNGTLELTVIRMSKYIDPSTNGVLFHNTILPERAFYTTDLEEIDLVSNIFRVAKNIADLKLTNTQLAIYSAIVLHNDERPGLTFPNEVKYRKELMLRALKAKLDESKRQPLENGVTVYDALNAKISELRTIGLMYVNAVAKFERSQRRLRFPKLHQEFFSGDPHEQHHPLLAP